MANVFSMRLGCEWESWAVKAPGVLALTMSNGHCCDMEGAVKIAEFLMPDVHTIHTVSGGTSDTIYMKGRGGWQAAI